MVGWADLSLAEDLAPEVEGFGCKGQITDFSSVTLSCPQVNVEVKAVAPLRTTVPLAKGALKWETFFINSCRASRSLGSP